MTLDLHDLIESLNEGIVALDDKNAIVYWNKGAQDIFGYASEEAVGRNIDELIAGERLQEAMAITREVFNLGNPVVFPETVRFRKNGAPVDVSISASPIVRNGRLEGGVGIYKDITVWKSHEAERRRVEEELRILKEFSENIVNSLAEGIVLEDESGRVAFINPTFETLLGYTVEELIGRDQEIFISPGELEKIRNKTNSRAKNTLETYETRFLHKNGGEIPVLVSAKSIFRKGQFKGVLSAITDISRLKKVEEALRASQYEAQAASRAKSEFLANVSHEIRTPMNGIIGMTELALDTALKPDQRDFLEAIRSSADSLMNIINDILDFSKIEARMVDLESLRFGLRDSISEAIYSLALDAHKKGLELACRVLPHVPDALVGDTNRLRQVLINLISNAIKFTEEGEVVVTVDAEVLSAGEAVRLQFSVSDTGIGIPPEKRSAIFQPFVQADGSMTRRFGGTGLGLSISSRIVEMMGGRIWVEGEPGRGSTFYFTAPMRLQEEAAGEYEPAKLKDLKDLSVLVIDDNATNRRILIEILTNWGMKPIEASGGPAALDILAKWPTNRPGVALALVDANMPDMDGFTLIARIRGAVAFKGMKIMMLTSADQKGDGGRCRDLGVSAYLTKPIRQSELLDAILLTQGAPPQQGRSSSSLITRSLLRRHYAPLRILIGEDNAINQKVAVHLLEKWGHETATAKNGKEVLAALRDRDFDLLLIDIQMPELGGLEVTAAIRREEKTTGRHLPIVALTAHALKEDRERCFAAGVDGYIAKPLRTDELFKTISRVIKKIHVSRRDGETGEDRAETVSRTPEKTCRT